MFEQSRGINRISKMCKFNFVSDAGLLNIQSTLPPAVQLGGWGGISVNPKLPNYFSNPCPVLESVLLEKTTMVASSFPLILSQSVFEVLASFFTMICCMTLCWFNFSEQAGWHRKMQGTQRSVSLFLINFR
jgi:hypothetical protein